MVGSFERRKDVVQVATESAATRLGRIAVIMTDAVRDVARELGDWVSDVAEISEASRRARADASRGHGADPAPDREPPGGEDADRR